MDKPIKLNAQASVDVKKLAAIARYLHRQGYQVNELGKIIGACVEQVLSGLRSSPKNLFEEFELDSEAFKYLLDTGFHVGNSDRQRKAIVKGLQAESLTEFDLPKAPPALPPEIQSRLKEAEARLQYNLEKGGSSEDSNAQSGASLPILRNEAS